MPRPAPTPDRAPHARAASVGVPPGKSRATGTISSVPPAWAKTATATPLARRDSSPLKKCVVP